MGKLLSCGMWDLVPWPGIEPWPPTLGAQSLSQWTTREVPVKVAFEQIPEEAKQHTVQACGGKSISGSSKALGGEHTYSRRMYKKQKGGQTSWNGGKKIVENGV